MKTRNVSLMDVVAVVLLAMFVASISLMNINRFRAAARTSACGRNLQQLGLAMHNYHSAFKRMPAGSGGTSAFPGAEPWQSNQDRLSVWAAMSPFYEQQALWEEMANPVKAGGRTFPAMGPVPWFDVDEYAPWGKRPTTLVCPTDPDAAAFPLVSSYVVNYGDAVHMVGSPFDPTSRLKTLAMEATNRGLFFGKKPMRFRDCLDGLSNTLMFSESCIASKPVARNVSDLAFDPSRCIAASEDPGTEFWPKGREATWADGCLRSSGFQTILPPNSPSATSDDSDLEGVMSTSSHHAGGVHVAFADGAVKFIMDAIDAGSSDSPTVALLPHKEYAPAKSQSPFGVWGAIGTRASAEHFNGDDSIMDPVPDLTAKEKENIKGKAVQTWTTSDGNQLTGRFVTIVDERSLIFLNQDGKVGRAELADLSETDRAGILKQHDQIVDAAIAELKIQATEALKLLDDRQFKQFAQTVMLDERHDFEQTTALVRTNRGFLIQTIEDLLREPDFPASRTIRRELSDNSPITVRLPVPGRSTFGLLRATYVDGRWRIKVR